MPEVRRLVVDGMNVIGSRPDGWWRDRDEAVRRLTVRLRRIAADEPLEVLVVYDGREVAGAEAGRVGRLEVRYARRAGRDAADDRIIELLGEVDERTTVVTADRELRDRARAAGAAVTGPRELLARLDALEPDREP